MKLKLQCLFYCNTTWYYLPEKGDLAVARIWAIIPNENISLIGYCPPFPLKFIIYGATYPGVPHLVNIYYG